MASSICATVLREKPSYWALRGTTSGESRRPTAPFARGLLVRRRKSASRPEPPGSPGVDNPPPLGDNLT